MKRIIGNVECNLQDVSDDILKTSEIVMDLRDFWDNEGVLHLSEQLILLNAYEEIIKDNISNGSLKTSDLDTIERIRNLRKLSREMLIIAKEAKKDLSPDIQ